MVVLTLGPEKKAVEAEESGTENEQLQFPPQLNSSFFCLSLRTGTQALGWIHAVVSLVGMSTWLAALALAVCVEHKAAVKHGYSNSSEVIFLSLAVLFSMIKVGFVMALLIGVYKEKAALLKPFILLASIALVHDVLSLLFDVATYNYYICNILFWSYSLLVVNSHYRELRMRTESLDNKAPVQAIA